MGGNAQQYPKCRREKVAALATPMPAGAIMNVPRTITLIREAGFASEVDDRIIRQQRFTEGGGCYGYELFYVP